MIKNPRILILDEATSALDEQSQEVVQQALDRAMEGRTSIVIAHRLSTIRNCDTLFMLGKGHVLESGSYDELSADPNSHFNMLKAGMENWTKSKFENNISVQISTSKTNSTAQKYNSVNFFKLQSNF